MHKLYTRHEYAEVRTRVQARRLKLTSDDPQVLYDAGAKVAQELRARLDQVVLRPDRLMLVRFNDGRWGTNSVEFTFTSGLIGACKRRVRADGARSNVAVVAVGITKRVR